MAHDCSLELLELGDLKRLLAGADEELKYPPESRYAPKVLVGNWFEERLQYHCMGVRPVTTYQQDFVPPDPPARRDVFEVEQRKQECRGRGHDLLLMPPTEAFLNNWSTSYDLHYRCDPMGLKEPRIRKYRTRFKRWEPEKDYTNNYGNLSNYGLWPHLQKKDQDRVDLSECKISEYSKRYRPPPAAAYRAPVATSRDLSSRLSPLNSAPAAKGRSLLLPDKLLAEIKFKPPPPTISALVY